MKLTQINSGERDERIAFLLRGLCGVLQNRDRLRCFTGPQILAGDFHGESGKGGIQCQNFPLGLQRPVGPLGFLLEKGLEVSRGSLGGVFVIGREVQRLGRGIFLGNQKVCLLSKEGRREQERERETECHQPGCLKIGKNHATPLNHPSFCGLRHVLICFTSV